MIRILISLICSLLAMVWSASPLIAQRSLAQVEVELAQMANEILTHPNLEHKIELNRKFSRKLIEVLERPESYSHAWDSLKTVAVLDASDGSFRMFTWQIVDEKDPRVNYGESSHYYFGLVQRRYESEKGKIEYLVIPLIEMPEIPAGVENMLLDNQNWIGGLYYQLRHTKGIPRETFKYYDPRQRNSKGEPLKVKQDFYILSGWNGLDHRSNIKFIDIMTFDREKPDRIIFGANVFYFDLIPKYRAIFKYSEYAPFSLNYSFVKKGLFGKKKMIIFDHLASPKPGEQKLKEIWEMGPDGSYDALEFKSRGGFFAWYKDVELAEDYNSRVTRKAIDAQRKAELDRLKEAGIKLPTIDKAENKDR